MKTYRFTLAALGLLILSACTPSLPGDLKKDRDSETEPDYYLAPSDPDNKPKDHIRSQLSSFFLVEQFAVGAHGSMISALKANAPGGILFWNGNGVGSSEIRTAVEAYSQAAEKEGLKPLLFSADYEGGAFNLAPGGKSVPGVQRFVKGFTSLAHPRWLGISMNKYGKELCQLHGKIMATELKAVGINYPLSVISDLATQGLTTVRGVSKDPQEVSTCLQNILEQFITLKDLVFVTKHFPGLGLTKGDTHDGTVTASTTDARTLESHLKPFTDLISLSKKSNSTATLSVMTTHAKFLGYDQENLTTESPKIITELLKDQLQFQGLIVSDAMWMGEYGHMEARQLMPVYLNSFLSGIDLLMIPGARFAQAVDYFRKVYDDRLTNSEKDLLTARTKMNWEETRTKFKARVTESLSRLDQVRSSLKPAHFSLKQESPTSLTTSDRERYQEILRELRAGN